MEAECSPRASPEVPSAKFGSPRLEGVETKEKMSYFEPGFGGARKPSRAKRGVGIFALVTFVAALLAITVLPTPYLIERPGPTFNVLGEVSGEPVIDVVDAPSYESEGALDVLTVSIVGKPENTPNWFEIALAWLDGSQKVVPVEALYPPNLSTEQVQAESSAMMEVSQQDAIAAALTYLGEDLDRQIYVAEVTANAAASGKIVAGDFVLKVDGKPLTDIEQLRNTVNAWDEGDPLEVTVLRSGKEITEQISPIKDEEGKYRLGLMVGYKYDFPITINLQLGDVGGPSGGMMFALGIIDRLTPGDLTGGEHVAGTGTISQDGQVGSIGGIVQKLYGAKRAGATVFLAPAANCSEVVGNEPSGLRVVRVETLKDAVSALDVVSSGGDLSALPSCTK